MSVFLLQQLFQNIPREVFQPQTKGERSVMQGGNKCF